MIKLMQADSQHRADNKHMYKTRTQICRREKSLCEYTPKSESKSGRKKCILLKYLGN